DQATFLFEKCSNAAICRGFGLPKSGDFQRRYELLKCRAIPFGPAAFGGAILEFCKGNYRNADVPNRHSLEPIDQSLRLVSDEVYADIGVQHKPHRNGFDRLSNAG